MKVISGTAALVCVLALAVLPAAALDASDIGTPGAAPDRIVLNPGPNVSVGQIFTWRTSLGIDSGYVQIRRGTGAVRTVKQFVASTTYPSSSAHRARHHTVAVNKLIPGAAYTYRVGRTGHWSSWRTFRTAAQTTNWTMLSLGDTQQGTLPWLTTVFDRAFTKVPQPSGVIQVGDFIEDPRRDSDWGTVFEAFGGRLGRINFFGTPGNHDQCILSRCDNPTSRSYFAHFEFAHNNVENQRQDWFYADVNNVRVVSLNSFASTSVQRAFLDHALSTNTRKWTIVIFHSPMFSGVEGRTNAPIRESWLPLLREHDVDLVLNGHDHIYSRGHLAGEPDGTQYVVQVTSPKYYRLTPDGSNDWTRHGAVRNVAEEHVSSYGVLRFSGDTLRYDTVIATKGADPSTDKRVGEVLDSFTIIKSAAGLKIVVD